MAEIGTVVQVIEHHGSLDWVVPGTRGIITYVSVDKNSYEARTDSGEYFLLIHGEDRWIECVVANHHE